MNLLISHSGVTMVEVVSEPSVLVGTEAAHLQYDLSSRRSFARYQTQIYSPLDLLRLDDSVILIRPHQGQFKKRKFQTPNVITS